MKRVLLDVNVVLDVLLDRAPFADASSAVWAAIEQGEAEALLSVFDVAAVDGPVLNAALALKWTDFEDAVTAAGARRAKCDAIVTRNPHDFKGSPVRVLTPSEAVAWLAAPRCRSSCQCAATPQRRIYSRSTRVGSITAG